MAASDDIYCLGIRGVFEPTGLFFFVPAKEERSDRSMLEDEGCDFQRKRNTGKA